MLQSGPGGHSGNGLHPSARLVGRSARKKLIVWRVVLHSSSSMMMMMIGNHRPEISSVGISSFVIKYVEGEGEAKVTLYTVQLRRSGMDGWMDGRMDMAAICQTKKQGGRRGWRRCSGSDLAVASGAADRQCVRPSVRGGGGGGRPRRRGSHTGEVHRVADPVRQGGDGWGN